MTPNSRQFLFPLAFSVLLVASGCKTTQPSSPQQTQRPPSPSQSPSSSPSMPSPPSSPGSQPSSPSVASPAPSMPSPSMPSPSMPDPASSQKKGDSKGEQGEQAEQTAQQSREKAGSDLEKAGEQVANAGEQMGDAGATGPGEPPEFPVDQQAKGQGEPDTLMPESDTTSQSDEIAFEDAAAADAAAGDPAAGDPAAGDAAAADAAAADAAAGDEIAGADSATADSSDPWQESASAGEIDEIAAAQAAMMEAGIKLQEAGVAVRTAESDADMARAQELLAEARVILIVAGQDLMTAQEATGEGNSAVFDAANEALNDATVAVVIATDAVMGLPDFGDLQTAGIPSGTGASGRSESGRIGELEDELEQSLIVFDGQILDARTVLMPPLPGASADLPGAGTGMPSTAASGDPRIGGGPVELPADDDAGEMAESGESSGANSAGNAEMASSENSDGQVALIPDDVGNGQNDDIVAQQLREAAVAETDPELQEKLWQEYRRYKSGR